VRLRGSDRADGWFGIAGEQGPGAIGTSPISAGTAVELGKKFLDLLQPGSVLTEKIRLPIARPSPNIKPNMLIVNIAANISAINLSLL